MLRLMTPLRVRTTLAIVLLAIQGIVTAVPVAALDEAPKLGLTPIDHDGAYFEITLAPGQRRALQVEAANFGAAEVLARTYAADVYSIINGGFGADLFGEPTTGTTLWVDFPTREALLGPGDALVIDLEVAVPASAQPGEYVAALVIENVDPVRGSGSVTIDQVNRSAIAIAITVPGARDPDLEIGGVAHTVAGGRSVVTFEIDNPGNVHLRPEGSYRVLDADDREVGAGSVAMDSVYAGTETLLEAPLAELLPEGNYCAELSLTDPATGVGDATACVPFTVGPTDAGSVPPRGPGSLPSTDLLLRAASFIALLGLVLSVIALFLVARRRRRRSEAPAGIALDDLRAALAGEDAVSRAWIVPRGSTMALAIEASPGTQTADGAELVIRVRRRLAEMALDARLSVLYLQGSGPVDRATAGVAPFYSRRQGTVPLRGAGA
jgi:hypothetical protein